MHSPSNELFQMKKAVVKSDDIFLIIELKIFVELNFC